MPTPFHGAQGTVTSWTDYAGLLSNWACPYQFSLNVAQDSQNISCFSGSMPSASEFVAGLNSWSGTISARFPTSRPKLGNNGLVSIPNGYDYNDGVIRSFTVAFTYEPYETTGFGSGGTTWKTFIPGNFSWNGSYEAHIDATNPLALVSSPGVTGIVAEFKLTEDGAEDNAINGDIQITTVTPTVNRDSGDALASYGFNGFGAPGVSGSILKASNNGVFSTGGVLQQAPVSALVLTSTTGRTLTGDAFVTSLSFSVANNTVIGLDIGFQGTSTLNVT